MSRPSNIGQGQGPVIPAQLPIQRNPRSNVNPQGLLGAHRVNPGPSLNSPAQLQFPPALISQLNQNARIHNIVARANASLTPEEFRQIGTNRRVRLSPLKKIPTAKQVSKRVQHNPASAVKYTSAEIKPLPASPSTDPRDSTSLTAIVAPKPQGRTIATAIAPLKSAVRKLLNLVRFQQNFDTVEVGDNQAVISKKYGTFIDLSPEEYAEIIKAGKEKLGMRSHAVISYERKEKEIDVTFIKTMVYNPNAGNNVAKIAFSVPDNVVLSASERTQLIVRSQELRGSIEEGKPFTEKFERPPLEIEVIARKSFMRIKSLDLLITNEQHFAGGGFGTVHTVTNIATGKQAKIEKRTIVDRNDPKDIQEATIKFNEEVAIHKSLYSKIRKSFKKNKKIFPNAFDLRRRCAVIARIAKIDKTKLSIRMKKYDSFITSDEKTLLTENKFDRLSERNKYRMISTMAAGPAILHDIGVVHRDIKLENYLMDSRYRAVTADFGESMTLKRPGLLNRQLSNAEKMNPFEGKQHTELYTSLPLAKKLQACVTGTAQRKEFNELLMKMDSYSVAMSVYLALTKTTPIHEILDPQLKLPPVTFYPTVELIISNGAISDVKVGGVSIPRDEWAIKVPNYKEKVKEVEATASKPNPPGSIYINKVELLGHNLAADAFTRSEWVEKVPDELKGILKGLLEGTADTTDNKANLQALSVEARKLSHKAPRIG